MLVLTRKIGEKIVIDGSITVEIMSVDGNKCESAGISPPPAVRIDREEIHRAHREFAKAHELAHA